MKTLDPPRLTSWDLRIAREHVLRVLAENHIREHGADVEPVIAPAMLSLAPHLGLDGFSRLFADLVDAVDFCRRVDDGDITANEMGPEVSTPADLDLEAGMRVDDALKAFTAR